MTFSVLRTPLDKEHVLRAVFPESRPWVDSNHAYRIFATAGEPVTLPALDDALTVESFPSLGDAHEWVLEDADDSLAEVAP